MRHVPWMERLGLVEVGPKSSSYNVFELVSYRSRRSTSPSKYFRLMRRSGSTNSLLDHILSTSSSSNCSLCGRSNNHTQNMKATFSSNKFFLCFYYASYLEGAEGLLNTSSLRLVRQNIETDRLGKRAALSNGDNITVLNSLKGRRAVGRNVLVPLLKTTVLDNVVQVIPSDNDRSLHLGGHDLSLENSSTDGNISSEGALLVDIVAFNSEIRGLDSKTDALYESHGLLAGRLHIALASDENGILLLIRLFSLIALLVFLVNSNHLDKLQIII